MALDEISLERLQKLLAYEIAENAKNSVTTWAKWPVGILLAVAATLGIKTYVDVESRITYATKQQITEAKKQANEALEAFEKEREVALSNFNERTDIAVTSLEADVANVLASVRESGRSAKLAILDVVSAQPSIRTVDRRARKRPIGPGLSVSGKAQTAGTICCVVEDKDEVKYILTAGFVVSDGQGVMQPGTMDGGTAQDQIGIVDRVSGRAALVRIDDSVDVYLDIPEVGPITGTAVPQLGEELRIFGRTSGLGIGTVTDTDVRMLLPLGIDGDLERANGYLITDFAEPGDGGAAVVNSKNELIGMHIAGSESVSFVIPIGPILSSFDVSLCESQ